MTSRELTTSLEAYREWIAQPGHEGRLFELIDGEIVEKMPSFEPSRIAMRIGTYLNLYLFQNPLGYVTGADGTYVMGESGNVFIPDVGYISKERLPQRPDREAPVPPDLAIEVKSPTDAKRALRQKAERYIASGTRMVWLVLPESGVVEVYLPDQDVIEVPTGGTLDGGALLPGFTLPVDDIFGG